MEKFDIYNARKEKTGKLGTRGIRLNPGAYRFVVHVIIFDSNAEKVLIQKRCENKTVWPGYWDFTAGGSAIAGEEVYQAAERELFEEIGLKLDLSDIASRIGRVPFFALLESFYSPIKLLESLNFSRRLGRNLPAETGFKTLGFGYSS